MSFHSLLGLFTHIIYGILISCTSVAGILVFTTVYTNLRYWLTIQSRQDERKAVQTPVKIPYTLPFIGCAFQFLNLSRGSFWDSLFKWHPRSTGACTLLMGGRTMHILYSPIAVSTLFKARAPTRDDFDVDVLNKGFGVAYSETLKYYGHGESADPDTGKTPKQEQDTMLYDYMLRTQRVNELTSEFVRGFQEVLSTDLADSSEMVVSLYSWLRNRMFQASTIAFFGDTLLQDCPNLEQDFYDFDRCFLTCFFQVPKFLAPEAYRIRNALRNDMEQYQKNNWERANGQLYDPDGEIAWEPIYGSRANRARQRYYTIRNLNFQTRGLCDLGFLFGASSNAIPGAGWILAHILNPLGDRTLFPRIMAELEAARLPNGSIDIPVLVDLPLLTSVFHEMMRLYSDTLVSRNLPNDIVVPIKDAKAQTLLAKGSTVVMPAWLGHRDDSSWPGGHCDSFVAERFLKVDPKTGEQYFTTDGTSGRFFPFGGGKTICPGRVFAKQEVLGAVAIILLEFDFDLLYFVDEDGKKCDHFPRLRNGYPGSGVINPCGDLKVRITRKSRP